MGSPEQSQIEAFLKHNKGKPYCDDCLAKTLQLAYPQQAEKVTYMLARLIGWGKEECGCSGCGKWKYSTRSA